MIDRYASLTNPVARIRSHNLMKALGLMQQSHNLIKQQININKQNKQ